MTPPSIVRSLEDVASEMIRRPAGASFARSPMRATIRGRRSTPPLAIAAYAAASCIGVTDSPWPIGRLPIEGPVYLLRASTRPGSSPGNSTFVGLPKPKRRTQ